MSQAVPAAPSVTLNLGMYYTSLSLSFLLCMLGTTIFTSQCCGQDALRDSHGTVEAEMFSPPSRRRKIALSTDVALSSSVISTSELDHLIKPQGGLLSCASRPGTSRGRSAPEAWKRTCGQAERAGKGPRSWPGESGEFS